MNTPWTSITLAIALISVSGCAPTAGEQWSSKDESLLGVRSDRPEDFLGEKLPVVENAANLREEAISILLQASESTNPLLRANAIEALQPASEHIEEVVQRGLGDENRGVRFVAAVTVGKLKLTQLAPLLEPLQHDESESVQAAAIYGMRRCGKSVDLNPLAEMLLGENPEVKANAAYVLGELGDTTALPMLRYAIGRGMIRVQMARRKIVEMQLAEAMVKLGATHQLEVIRAALFAPPEQGELVALACQMSGEVKDGAAVPNLLDLAMRTGRRQQSAEVRMAAARAVAMIEPSRAPIHVPGSYMASDRFEIRAQAAMTLARYPGEDPLPYLARLINDSNPLVQVAAAGGILLKQPSAS